MVNNNKVTSFVNVLNGLVDGKEDKSNKVTSWSSPTTDTHYPSEKLVKDSLDGKASSTHNHTKSQITDFPTSMTPTSHTHGNLQNNGQVGSTAQANKNVVTDSSGKITTEDKPTIPSASSTTPSADTTSGSVGTGTTWARSNHTHPKSSLYAEATHNHAKSQITDFPTIPSKTSDLQNDSGFLTSHQSLSGYLQTSDVKDNLTSTDTDKPLSAKQGKELKSLIDNKEDKIYRIVGTGTQIGTLFPNRVELQGTFPFDSVNGKIIVYVVPDISSLSEDLLLDLQGTYPSGSTIKFNIRKSNDAPISIGEIQTGDELLLFYDNSRWRLIGNSSISGKEDSSNKVSSWSGTTTDTNYPSEKLVKDSLDLKSDSTHTHTIDLNSFDFYDADNWRTIDGNAPTITSDSIQANAVSHHILNKEFLESKHYTLTFEFNTGSNRGGFYLFGDEDCNMLFEITTDIRNTFTLQYDSTGNTTELYAGTKNHFTYGWHDIKVIRKGATATLYIDDELYYTFNNIGNSTNIFGLFKWGSGSVTIRNVDVSLDVTELPVDDYVGRDELDDYVEKNNLKTIEGVNLVGSEDIAIDVSCGGDSTIIFEDECSSNENLGEYGTVKSIYGSTTTGTIEYDSTYNGYALNRTGTSSNSDATIMFPITSLTGLDNLTIEADIQSQHIAYNRIGFGCVDSYGNTAFFTIGHDAWSSALRFFYGDHSSITAIVDDESFTQQWYHIVVNVQGNSYLADLYLSDTKVASVNGSYSLDISTRDVGIMLGCPSNSTCWVKNIKVENLNGGSENTIYLGDDILTMIDTALGHMITNWEEYE